MTRPDLPSEARPTAADLFDRKQSVHCHIMQTGKGGRWLNVTYHPGADSLVGVPGCEEKADGERIPSDSEGGGDEK